MSDFSTLDILQACIHSLKRKVTHSEKLENILDDVLSFHIDCEQTADSIAKQFQCIDSSEDQIFNLREQNALFEKTKELAISSIENEESPIQLFESLIRSVRGSVMHMESLEKGGYDTGELPTRGSKLILKMERENFV